MMLNFASRNRWPPMLTIVGAPTGTSWNDASDGKLYATAEGDRGGSNSGPSGPNWKAYEPGPVIVTGTEGYAKSAALQGSDEESPQPADRVPLTFCCRL